MPVNAASNAPKSKAKIVVVQTLGPRLEGFEFDFFVFFDIPHNSAP
jgi:hypothetical protein